MPANAQMFFKQINKVASFDIINIEPFINKALNLNKTEPMNENFAAIGFNSMYFMNNMGSLIIGFLIYFVGLIVMFILQRFLNRKLWINRYFRKLKKMLLYDTIVAMMIESYSLICVCCLISFYNVTFASYGEIVQTVVNFFFFSLVFAFPAILFGSIMKHWRPLSRRSTNVIKLRFGAVFGELRMDKGHNVLLQPFYFLLRRLLMAIVAVVFRNFLWMQIFLTAMTIVAAVILIGEADFFETSFKKKMEFANEVLVMFMLYSMISFSPFVPDIDTRFKMGYFCCIVEAFALAANLWLIISSSVKGLILKVRVYFAKKHLYR